MRIRYTQSAKTKHGERDSWFLVHRKGLNQGEREGGGARVGRGERGRDRRGESERVGREREGGETKRTRKLYFTRIVL